MKKAWLLFLGLFVFFLAPNAQAATFENITFESPTYSIGDVGGQDEWTTPNTNVFVNVTDIEAHTGSQSLWVRDFSASDFYYGNRSFTNRTEDGLNVSVWIRVSSITQRATFYLYLDSTMVAGVYLGGYGAERDGCIRYHESGNSTDTWFNYTASTWHQYLFTLNFTDDDFHLYLDGAKVFSNWAFYNAADGVNRIEASSGTSPQSYHVYFDDIIVATEAGASSGCSRCYNDLDLNCTRCGGENMQLVYTCTYNGSDYRWDDSREYCQFGCFNGSCINVTEPCFSECAAGVSACSGAYQIWCNDTDSDGCYEWTEFNKTHCPYGCFNGACLPFYPQCREGELHAENNFVYNCSLNDDGYRVWTLQSYCRYGFNYSYSGNNVTSITCNIVGDAHDIASGIERASVYLNFILSPVIAVIFVVLSLLISGFFVWKSGDSNIGIWLFILFMGVGSWFQIIPVYIGLPVIILSIAWKTIGGLL